MVNLPFHNLRGTDGVTLFIGLEMVQGLWFCRSISLAFFAIATAAYRISRCWFKPPSDSSKLELRFAGLAICSAGTTFVSNLIVEIVFPA